MRSIQHSLLLIFITASFAARSQNAEVVKNYINTYKDLAITEMKRTGVPAAITLAQGIHESGAGLSKLVQASNNHFGIKCKSNWTGESVKHDDDARKECFRKYPQSEDSYRDHSDFLKNGQRYAFLFQLEPEDYTGWANGLKKAGYATNPKYPQVLIKTVEDYGLQQYTLLALGKIQEENFAMKNQSDTSYKGVGGFKSIAKVFPAANEQAVPIIEKKIYPDGEFKINETKVVYVKKGTSFLGIAKQYAIDLSKIFEFNEIPRSEETDKDQLIYLQRKRKTGVEEFHTVQPGETLHDVAQKQAIRIETLRELNWLKEDERPAPGERLSLKKKSAVIPKLKVKENYSITGSEKKN
jgi:LysM repeat protein